MQVSVFYGWMLPYHHYWNQSELFSHSGNSALNEFMASKKQTAEMEHEIENDTYDFWAFQLQHLMPETFKLVTPILSTVPTEVEQFILILTRGQIVKAC